MNENGRAKPLPYQAEGVRQIEDFGGRVLLADEMGLGKQQPISEPVLTPDGWKPIGDLQVGDLVIGVNGKPTKVIGVFPQADRRVVRITFSDGSWTRCGWDHLWAAQTANDRFRGKKFRVLTTKQIADQGLFVRRKGRKNRKWFIPIANPINYPEAKLPIHPYVLGVLLGDGHLSHAKLANAFTPGDEKVPELVRNFVPDCYVVTRSSTKNRWDTWRITTYPKSARNPILDSMRKLGLAGIDSASRHIPEMYMWASVKQRTYLLQGLIDTDGHIRHDSVTFSSCSERLRDQIVELVNSLGGTASKRQKMGKIYGTPKRMSYWTSIRLPYNIVGTLAFRDKWQPISKYKPLRAIDSITEEPDEDSVCISVNAEDGLYVTRNHIVTHNTLQVLWALQRNPNWLPALIVCPASVKYQWEHEALRHTGMRSAICEGQTPPRFDPYGFQFRPPLTIINYDILQYWTDYLRRVDFQTVVFDECHFLKSLKTKRTKAGRRISRRIPRVIALSGTPLENRPAELWPILNIIWPDEYPQFYTYARRFCNPKWTHWGWDYRGSSNLPELHRQLKVRGMIRRRKSEVLKELPDKVRRVMPCALSNHKEYRDASDNFLGWLRKNQPHKVRAAARAEKLARVGYLLRLSAKLKMRNVVDWANRYLAETDEKLVLFAIHKGAIDVLRRRVKAKSIIVDGMVTGRKRHNAIQQFQQDPKTRLAICNLRAGGVGINLTAASTMGVVEIWWNPGAHLQAEKRIDRIGQKRTCWIYYLVAGGTIEERLCQLLQKRQDTINSVLDGDVEPEDFDLYNELIQNLEREL